MSVLIEDVDSWGAIMERRGDEADDMVQTHESGPYPLVATQLQSSERSPFDRFVDFMGSIGQTARDIGTAVGTVERDVRTAGDQYKQAREQAANPTLANRAGQLWSYSSPMDKTMLILGVVGIGVAVWAANKKG